MIRAILATAAAASALAISSAAFAATDYLLELDGVAGESAVSGEVLSWSLGASNPTSIGSSGMSAGRVTSPRDAASGQATGRRQHHPAPTAAGSSVSTLAGGGSGAAAASYARGAAPAMQADLATLDTQSEIQGFTLTFGKSSPVLAKVCSGQHIASATLTSRNKQKAWLVSNFRVTGCTDAGQPVVQSATTSSTRESSAPSMSERCASGQCAATGDVSVTFTGQMRNTKTGHVTLLK